MGLHLLARCGVGPAPDVAAHYFAAFGNHVFNGHVQIGHGLVHGNHHLFVAIHASGLSARSVVLDKLPVGSEGGMAVIGSSKTDPARPDRLDGNPTTGTDRGFDSTVESRLRSPVRKRVFQPVKVNRRFHIHA